MNNRKNFIYSTLIMTLISVSYSGQIQAATSTVSDHFSATTQKFHNRQATIEPVAFRKVVGVLWNMLRHEKNRAPVQTLPMQKPDWDTFLNATTDNQFIWFGHSTLLMRMSGQTIAIDPVFGSSVAPMGIMMRRFQAAPAEIKEFPKIDLVIISHNHYDHLEQNTIQYLAKHSPETHFIVPLGLASTLSQWGVSASKITELDWWQSYTLGNINITATESQHSSGRGVHDTNRSLWAGWVIQDTQQTIFYSGDNGYGKHYAEIGQRFPNIKIAFIENGQYNSKWAQMHMKPSETAQAAKDLGTEYFVPVHWGAYTMAQHHWNASVLESVSLVRSYGIKTITPLMGQVFNSHTQTSEWYKNIQ